MNNEKKYREIAKFCMKQKADKNIAKEYEEYGMKDAMRASKDFLQDEKGSGI